MAKKGAARSLPPDPKSVKVAGASGPQILTFALQHRPRATRASVPKVRTGCLTCKKRHVKCDEAKPSCQRCMRWQGFCEGYDTRGSGSSSSSSSSSAGSARSSNSPPAMGGALVRTGRVTVLPDPSGDHVFASGWERIYFDDWISMANNMGGGWFQSELFTRTIPQLSREEPALRYAAMAIGAMANAMTPNVLPRSCSSSMVTTGPHYKNALTYYGQALRLVRLQRGPTDAQVRSAILACLLFVCFETLHSHREAALHHINHGLMIVEQFLRAKKEKTHIVYTGPPPVSSPSTDPSTNPSTPSTTSTEDNRPVLEMDAKSPAPYVLEDEIIQVFQRLDFQSWSTGLLTPRRRAPSLYCRTAGNHSAQDIPSSFHSLAEARRWWDLVQHWILHFHRTIVDELDEIARSTPDQAAAARLDFCDIPGVTDRRTEHVACLERWHAAFWPLYMAATREASRNAGGDLGDDYFRAASLRLQYQLAWISTRAICFSDYETMYNMTPHFRELIRLGAVLLPNQGRVSTSHGHHNHPSGPVSTETFTLDNGPTMALFVTATKCRDADVREEAIALMKRYPRRDGFWDSRAMVLIAELNRMLEAENETEGTLAEQWARLRQRDAVFDPSGKSATVRYYKRDAQGKWYMAEELMRFR